MLDAPFRIGFFCGAVRFVGDTADRQLGIHERLSLLVKVFVGICLFCPIDRQ